jgi:hypothetical protein
MRRAIRIIIQVVTVLCLAGMFVLACASSVAPALARGTAHRQTLGWAALLGGIGAMGGATLAIWNGFMDLSDGYMPTVHFTAEDQPGPFFAYVLFFYLAGIVAVMVGMYFVIKG